MGFLRRRLGSSLGLKYVMAATGVGLFGFVVAHLTGNLLIYRGPEALNAYAQGLQSLGPLLWAARAGLLVLFVTHVVTALMLTTSNRRARPIAYACQNTVKASYASRTMPMSGLIVLAFIGYHLAHFTMHWVGGDIGAYEDALGRHDVYKMVVLGFQNPVSAGLYIAAMVLLGLHMSHGLSSLFQSLGLRHRLATPLINRAGPVLAWSLALANISMPVAVLTGFISLAGGGQ